MTKRLFVAICLMVVCPSAICVCAQSNVDVEQIIKDVDAGPYVVDENAALEDLLTLSR